MKFGSIVTLFTAVGKIIGVGFKIVEAFSHTPIPEIMLCASAIHGSYAIYKAYNTSDDEKPVKIEEFDTNKYRISDMNVILNPPGDDILKSVLHLRFKEARKLYDDLDENSKRIARSNILQTVFNSVGVGLICCRTFDNWVWKNRMRMNMGAACTYMARTYENASAHINKLHASPELLSKEGMLEHYIFCKNIVDDFHSYGSRIDTTVV